VKQLETVLSLFQPQTQPFSVFFNVRINMLMRLKQA